MQESSDKTPGMNTYVVFNDISDQHVVVYSKVNFCFSLAKIKAHEVERAQKWAKMAKKHEKNGEVMHSFDWSPKVIGAFI
jgi:hypothetical protein